MSGALRHKRSALSGANASPYAKQVKRENAITLVGQWSHAERLWRTECVPVAWESEPGKWKCNVRGVSWMSGSSKWLVQHTDITGKCKKLPLVANFVDAAKLRDSLVDGKATAGDLEWHGGVLCVSKCSVANCRREHVPIVDFAPNPLRMKKAFAAFAQACRASDEAALAAMKQAQCRHCRCLCQKTRVDGRNSNTADCRKTWMAIKQKMQELGGCVDCGELDVRVLEGDHDPAQKEYQLSDYMWWAGKYGSDGPEHMLKEFKHRGMQCRCRYCHNLQDTHAGARPSQATAEKIAYNNAKKREIGKCVVCRRSCISGNERGFDWMHNDECDKQYEISELVTRSSVLAVVKPKLDAEYERVRLGCKNCPKIETAQRHKEGLDLWDELDAFMNAAGPA
jgi:hypothetical protein